MANRRLLISYAHPDDESFGSGGLIAKYVDEGVDVYLICATNGDAGSMDEEFLENGNTIKDVRLAELNCAVDKLGFKDVFMLGYRDSGMMGTPANEEPDCLWWAWNNEPDRVTQQIVEIVRAVKPHVVLTFNEYGGYGHPDHIAIQQATVEAVTLASSDTYITDGLPPYQPQKLYYSSIPRLPVQLGIWSARLRGKDPRKLGRNNDIDIVAILENTIEPTTRVNISNYLDIWDNASECHQSQGGGGGFIGLPRWVRRRLFPTQGFTRIFPPVEQDGIIERDLFENVQVETEPEVTPT
jgi:mycothiol S-conjugate amidase